MKFTIGKIELLENVSIPKIAVKVYFTEGKPSFNQKGSVEVLLDYQNYAIEEIKIAAVKAAKELLQTAANAEIE